MVTNNVPNDQPRSGPSIPLNAAPSWIPTDPVSAASRPPPSSTWGGIHSGSQHGAHPSRHQQTTTLTLCLFHIPFGNSARRCTPACSRWNEQNRSRDATDTRLRAHPVFKANLPPRSTPSWTAQLGLIVDDNSQKRCLLDTGSQVSLWPPSPSSSRLPLSRIRMTAANGTPIQAFGQQRKDIKIGGKSYPFIFLIAQVSRPILGLHFLKNFGMTINLCKGQLQNSGTSTCFSSASSEISGLNVIHAPSPFLRALEDFPEITDVALASSTSHGPPVKTSPRRLTPPKNSGLANNISRSCVLRASVDVLTRLGARASIWWPRRMPLRRLSAPQWVHFQRRIPHPAHSWLLGWPFWVQDLFENRPGEGLPPGPRTCGRRPEDSDCHALRTLQIHVDAVWPQKHFADVPAPHGQHHTSTARHIGLFGWCISCVSCARPTRATSSTAVPRPQTLQIGAQRNQMCLWRARAQVPQPQHLEQRHQATAWEGPRSVKSLQRFLGLVNFYWRFLPDIEATMHPFTDALAGAPWQLTWNESMMSAFT